MPKLGDFIGAFLADAVQARVRADLESLKIAEIYSQHDLLKHFPVPRFRLPDITVDFPVVVSSLEEPPGMGGGRLFEKPPRTDITRIVRRALLESGLRMTYKARGKVYASADKRSAQLLLGGTPHLSSRKVSAEMAAAVANTVRSQLPESGGEPDKLARFETTVKDSIRALMLTRLTQSPRIEVAVASGSIKEHDDSGNLPRIRLTISEDALEVVDRNGDDRDFILTPE